MNEIWMNEWNISYWQMIIWRTYSQVFNINVKTIKFKSALFPNLPCYSCT